MSLKWTSAFLNKFPSSSIFTVIAKGFAVSLCVHCVLATSHSPSTVGKNHVQFGTSVFKRDFDRPAGKVVLPVCSKLVK